MPDEIQCPVCRARQTLQAECRRCRADLRLFKKAVLALQDVQLQLATALRDNPQDETLAALQARLNWLSPKALRTQLALPTQQAPGDGARAGS